MDDRDDDRPSLSRHLGGRQQIGALPRLRHDNKRLLRHMLHRYAIYRTHRRWVRRYRLAKTRLEEEFSISGSVIRTAAGAGENRVRCGAHRSEEHTSELQSLMRTSYAVFCLTT